MLIVGAALGMVMLTRANESFVQAQSIADETRDINDIYKDTSRTRLALMQVYAEEKEDGKKALVSDNLATAQKHLKRGQSALQAFSNDAKSAGTDAQMRGDLVAATSALYGSLELAAAALQADDIESFKRINLGKSTAQGAAVSNFLDRFQKSSTGLGKQLMAQRDAEYHTVELLVGLGILQALALVR